MFGRRRDESVPLELARRLHAEREAALMQLQRAREEAAQLRRALEVREEERRTLARAAQGLQAELTRARAEAHAAHAAECEVLRQKLVAAEVALAENEREHAHAEARLGELHREPPEETARVAELLGDLANIRRRRDEDVAAGQRAERVRLLARLAEVRDSVAWGLAAATDRASPWYAGLEAIRDQVDTQLHAEGATLFGTVGEFFDPHQHEALAMVPLPDHPPGRVARVERPGIRLADGTLVRPARVLVVQGG
jgi:molecular chaperone GrpE